MTGTVVNDRKGQAKNEIDVVALDKRAGRAEIRLIGEAKAPVTRRSAADLDRLDRLKELLAEHGHDTGSAVLALFSMEGFQPDLVSTARRRGDVLLVGLPALVDAGDPVVVPGAR